MCLGKLDKICIKLTYTRSLPAVALRVGRANLICTISRELISQRYFVTTLFTIQICTKGMDDKKGVFNTENLAPQKCLVTKCCFTTMLPRKFKRIGSSKVKALPKQKKRRNQKQIRSGREKVKLSLEPGEVSCLIPLLIFGLFVPGCAS